MSRNNSIWLGLLIGLALPALGYPVLLFLYEQLEEAGIVSSSGFSGDFRQRTVAILALCLNLLPLRRFQGQRATRSIRGLVLATLLLGVLWFIYFNDSFL